MEHVYDINMQYLHSTMKNTLNIAFGVPKFEIKKVIFNPPATDSVLDSISKKSNELNRVLRDFTKDIVREDD